MRLNFVVDHDGLVQAGQRLSGKLVIDNRSGTVSARKLVVFLRGKEKVSVGYDVNVKKNDGTTKTRHEALSDEHEFFKVDIPISNDNIVQRGLVPAAYFEVPFSLLLPPSLPGSFEERASEDRSDRISISYLLRATLEGSGFLWDYYTCYSVKVLPAPYFMEQEGLTRRSCTAQIKVSAHCFNTNLAPGQKAVIELSNDPSSAKLRKIQFSVEEHIRWGIEERKRHISYSLCSKSYTMSTWGFNNKIKHLNRSVSVVFCLPKIPSVSHGSLEGQLFCIQHEIKIVVTTKSNLTHSIRIPIKMAPHGSMSLPPRAIYAQAPVDIEDGPGRNERRLPIAEPIVPEPYHGALPVAYAISYPSA